MADFWDEWRGDLRGNATMLIKTLARQGDRRIDLHKFIAPDAPGCFHTHPAPALRLILWGGYVEELENGTRKTWRPGMLGLVRPELCHRVAALSNGRCSYSLWIRGRKTGAGIELRGDGWRSA